MIAKLKSAGIFGMDAFIADVEAYISDGFSSFEIVGLPDASVKEAKERVRAAIANSGGVYPAVRITVNIAPADIKKSGTLYDLPILLSLLKAGGQLKEDLDDSVFIGELSLDGDVRPAGGVLAMVIKARQCGFKKFYIPVDNAAEGSVVEGIEVYPVENVRQLVDHIKGFSPIKPVSREDFPEITEIDAPDFSDVKGQFQARRALEIAAAGGHNVLMIGPPGSGKSMLAKRLPSILPDMTFEEKIETTKLHSIAGILPKGAPLVSVRPFRSPHHTMSPIALSGGGSIPKPGEISLAHNGVLFLDELPEFSRTAMEALRQPLEDGRVVISRVSATLSYPCDIMLVAAMNPCPCGFYGHPTRKCVCPEGTPAKYLNRVSGPLLDRFDLHIEVPSVEFEELDSSVKSEGSAAIKKRVNAARKLQQQRYSGKGFSCNSNLTPALLHEYCHLTEDARAFLKRAFEKLGMSGRAYDRVLKVARTIADLDGSDTITKDHIAETVQYRSLDRKYWQQK